MNSSGDPIKAGCSVKRARPARAMHLRPLIQAFCFNTPKGPRLFHLRGCCVNRLMLFLPEITF